MIEMVIAAPSSGSGKTVAACGLLAALAAQGLNPCAFKCGPDYIDPMFHRAVLGVESHNLDLFLSGEEQVRALYAESAGRHDAVVCEGVMGLYDGVGGSTLQASTWQVADTLKLPVLLVLRPKGASLTFAAVVRGLRDFTAQSRITGLFLNECTPSLYRSLAPVLERETGIPVLGYLPSMPQARFESRHLGLYTAAEIKDLQGRIQALADKLQATVDWPRLFSLFAGKDVLPPPKKEAAARAVPIAVARDEAFCFAYAETLEALQRAGAELIFFSPLRDSALPSGIGGLYLPGGYPELYAKELSQNQGMLRSVAAAVRAGLPTVAECGGFLYLNQSLQDQHGSPFPMVGALAGQGFRTEKLVRFGYAQMTARQDSLLFRRGETVPVHEFHYWDSTQNGEAFQLVKPTGKRSWNAGFATPSLYAAFPHLYFAGELPLASRFAAGADRYLSERRMRHG